MCSRFGPPNVISRPKNIAYEVVALSYREISLGPHKDILGVPIARRLRHVALAVADAVAGVLAALTHHVTNEPAGAIPTSEFCTTTAACVCAATASSSLSLLYMGRLQVQKPAAGRALCHPGRPLLGALRRPTLLHQLEVLARRGAVLGAGDGHGGGGSRELDTCHYWPIPTLGTPNLYEA
jgi:hypothetical protein